MSHFYRFKATGARGVYGQPASLDVKRLVVLALLLALTGCREVRVQTLARGDTTASGGNAIVVVRTDSALRHLGIRAAVNYRSEFGVVLLMGPHDRTGYRQIIESIRATASQVRVVAFERAPANGGEPTQDYRTYTLWIVPNTAYRRGIAVNVVTPDGSPVTHTTLP